MGHEDEILNGHVTYPGPVRVLICQDRDQQSFMIPD